VPRSCSKGAPAFVGIGVGAVTGAHLVAVDPALVTIE